MTAAARKYEKLLTEVAPRPITDAAQHERALAAIDRLMSRHARSPDPALEDMIEVLATLIEAYEREASPFPKVSPVQMLEHLMGERELSRQQFAKAVGLSPTHVSNVLNGTRDITLEQARKFGKFIGVSPRLFLGID